MTNKKKKILEEALKMHKAAGGTYSSPEAVAKQRYANARHEIAKDYYNQYFGAKQSESLAKAGEKERSQSADKPKETLDTQPLRTSGAERIALAESRAAKAKKDFEDYMGSDERKQKEEAHKKQELSRFTQQLLGGNADIMQPQMLRDEKEAQLRKEADKAGKTKDILDSALASQERARETTSTEEADLAEIQTMTPEERRQLDEYIFNREQKFYSGFDPTKSDLMMPQMPVASPLEQKYGKKRLDELAESQSRKNQRDISEKALQDAAESAGGGVWDAVGHSALAVLAGASSGVGKGLDYLKDKALGTERYDGMDPNGAGSFLGNYAGTVQGTVADKIEGDTYDEEGNLVEDGGWLRKGLSMGYQGLMSAAESSVRALLFGGSAGGAAVAAADTFVDGVNEAMASGATQGQATSIGLAKAMVEFITEKIPMDRLTDLIKGGGKSLLRNMAAQAGEEATTEVASYAASILAEWGILREKSGYQQKIAKHILDGVNPEEAKKLVDREVLNEATETAIVSGFAGAFGGISGTYIGDKVEENAQGDLEQVIQPEEVQLGEQQGESPLSVQQDPVGQGTESAPVMPEEAASAPETRELDVVTQAVQQARQNREAAQNAQQEPTLAQQLTPEQRVQEAVKGVHGKGNTPQTNAVSNPIDSYPPEKQKSIRSYLQSVDKGIKDFVQRVKGGDSTFTRMKISNVNERAAQDIGDILGIDARGYTHNINTNGVQHILRRHGENGKHDQTMSVVDDIARVGWVLENYDSVEPLIENGKQAYSSEFRGKDNKPIPQIRFVKKIDGSYYVVEAAFENKYKKLWVQAAYLQKNNGDVTQAPAESLSANHETNAQSALASPSPTNSIAAASQEVNGNPAQESDNLPNGQQPAPEGMKGTGAAEQNFTGKEAYNATLSAENAQADRRDDVRTMELPKADVDGKNVSAVTGNVYGSKITPDELASLMEEPVARGDFSYAKITNDQATKRAVAAIESAGTWETAFDGWKQDVTKGVAGAEVSARGALLLNRAAETGNKQQWLETLHYMQMLGTNTAQGLQALRIVRTLSIPDKMAFTRMTVNNYIAALAKDGVKIEKGGINALLDQYESASDDAQRDAILSDIQQNIADQVPSTFMEKWNALRYTNMLGNLKTQGKNILGNVGMSVNYKLKDKTAAVIENLVYHLSGKKFERTKSLRIDPKMKRAAMADFKQFADIVSDGGKYGDQLSAKDAFARGVEDKRTIFKSENRVIDAFLKPMEKYRRATNWAMNNEHFGDEAFGRSAYANALAGYLQAHGIKDGDLSKVDAGLMDKARSYAIQQAQEATFHDDSAFARTMSKLQKDSGILGQALLPFVKTPANVGTRAMEFSPLGFLKTAVDVAKKTAAGNEKLADRGGRLGEFVSKGAEITGNDIIDSLAKNLTGTGLFVLGCALRNAGLISGGADEDEEKDNFDKLNGEQNYAFLLPGGGSYTLDWLNPTAVPLFMGANLWDIVSEKSELTFSDLESVLTAVAEPMLEMSMLQGISDALDSVKYSDNNLVQMGLNAAVNYLSQGLTNTLLGQLEKSTEEKRTTTYVDKDSQVPVWAQKALGKASQKIPGWDYQQVPYINARGEEEKQPTGVEGLLYNTLSPGYYKEGYSDDVTKELNRLYETPEGDGSLFPSAPSTTVNYTDTSGNAHQDYHMTPEESETLRKTYGQTYNQVIGELAKSKDYQALSDRLKVKAAQLAKEYATERGKAAALADYPQATDWTAGIEGREAEAIVRKVTTSALNDAISAVFTRTKNGWDTKEAESGMEKVYAEYEALSRSAKADILDDATTETRRYLEARKAGISHKDFLAAAKNVETVKGTGKYNSETKKNTVKDIDKWEAIAKTTGLTEHQVDIIMKAYMPDYDPDAEKKEKTELKYDYIRQELGMTPVEYADTYRAYLENAKKHEKIAAIQDLGYDYTTASKLYRLYQGKIDVVAWAGK